MSTATYSPETFPNHWLPADATFHSWDQIEPLYQQLLDRSVDSPGAFEEWLRDVGELNSAVSQEGSKRYIAMTCQTDDPEREKAHLEFVREIEPKLKPYLNRLRNAYLDSPHRKGLPEGRYHVYDRAQENRRRLFREANIPRETQIAELGQSYQKAIGAMTVTFHGEEKTLAQMAPYLEEPDRALREEVWKLVSSRRLQDRESLDGIFDRMIKLRGEIASEAGFPDYVAYAYASRERFDYGPEQAEEFQKAIETEVVPLARRLQEHRKKVMGLPSIRPWDLSVDPRGRPPLRPFADADALAEKAARIFTNVDADLGAQFSFMRKNALLDLANRKGKAPGGYQANLEADRLPFIFMNAVGVDDDVRTVLHEGGHAFHTLAARGEPLADYRDAPIEFCEVASMSMELLGAPELDEFYSEADAKRSYRELLEGIVLILPWIATVDAFQHWIYRNPEHSQDDRRAAWNALMDRFGGIVDWSGFEEVRSNSWHRQLHIFLYPFYYIEYGIAQLGALQVWRRSLDDREAAVSAYRSALSLGGSRPLPELFEAAGARFDFSSKTIAPLMREVHDELDRLGDV